MISNDLEETICVAIQRYLYERYNLDVGDYAAMQAYEQSMNADTVMITGRDVRDGIPHKICEVSEKIRALAAIAASRA